MAVRKRLPAIVTFVLVIGVAVGIAAFLSQGQRSAPELAVTVASADAIVGLPVAVTVTIQEGMDRVLQREGTRYSCSLSDPLSMGCPASTVFKTVTIYLVRDDGQSLHAFIGEDPRNGCALIWRTDIHAGSFYDPCHGSFYDPRGRVIGGPSPWNLNELAAEVRGSTIYLYPTRFVIGDCPGCLLRGAGTGAGQKARQNTPGPTR